MSALVPVEPAMYCPLCNRVCIPIYEVTPFQPQKRAVRYDHGDTPEWLLDSGVAIEFCPNNGKIFELQGDTLVQVLP